LLVQFIEKKMSDSLDYIYIHNYYVHYTVYTFIPYIRKDLSVSGNPIGWKICVKELLYRSRLFFSPPRVKY
jgi:hypothetical protein